MCLALVSLGTSLVLQGLQVLFSGRADAEHPGKLEDYIVVITELFTIVGIGILLPGYPSYTVKLSIWGGAKVVLGEKVHCNWSQTIEMEQEAKSVVRSTCICSDFRPTSQSLM